MDGARTGGPALTAPGGVPDLRRLDVPRPCAIDADIGRRNLEALAELSPALAELTQRTAIPSHWLPVLGLDDWPTWRVAHAGEPPAWLGGSAAPATRAAGLVPHPPRTDVNLGLTTIAAGAELDRLLRLTTPLQAVFVFEDEWPRVAAVLRLLPLDEPLRAGRLFLIHPLDEATELERCLVEHPGLLPPGNLICPPGCAPERLAHLRRLCEDVANRIHARRSARIAALNPPPRTGMQPSPRLAVAALGGDAGAAAEARALAAAARQQGWPVCLLSVERPEHVHPLPHAQALAEFGPTLTLRVRPDGVQLPAVLLGDVGDWWIDELDLPLAPVADGLRALAGTPAIAAALRASAGREGRIVELPLACHDHSEHNDLAAPTDAARATVVVCGDRADLSAAACGIVQPTHVQLWEALLAVTQRAVQRGASIDAEALLRAAQDAAGVVLGLDALRTHFQRLVTHALAPTLTLDAVSDALLASGMIVAAIGRGWEAKSSDRLTIWAQRWAEWPDAARRRRPLAAIFAGRSDPLTPALLGCAGSGWPLLLHTPGGRSLTPALAGMLHPEQHYAAFDRPADAAVLVASAASDAAPFAARAARARRALLAHQTYRDRLPTLFGLSQAPTEAR